MMGLNFLSAQNAYNKGKEKFPLKYPYFIFFRDLVSGRIQPYDVYDKVPHERKNTYRKVY